MQTGAALSRAAADSGLESSRQVTTSAAPNKRQPTTRTNERLAPPRAGSSRASSLRKWVTNRKAVSGDGGDDDGDDASSKVNYWHYKQTGIKSRPIKLLRHPIEHIERKILFTYFLGFLFKLIAILTGPIVVLIAYLMTVPCKVARHSIWCLLNSTANVKIRTMADEDLQASDSDSDDDGNERGPDIGAEHSDQVHWNYCPLSYIETYWFREKLVNNVILVINDDASEFSIGKLRALVRQNILAKVKYRKFLSVVVSRGLPLYKSHYWRHLGLADEADSEHNQGAAAAKAIDDNEFGRASSASSIGSDESGRSSLSSSPLSSASLQHPISIAQDHNDDLISGKIRLSNHIYIDRNLSAQLAIQKIQQQQPENPNSTERPKMTTSSAIRQYAYELMKINLNLSRPLWEIRVIPTPGRRTFLVFRCHQCLADGSSLSRLLTDHLTESPLAQRPRRQTKTNMATDELAGSRPEIGAKLAGKDEENKLELIKEKKSFISRISRSDSSKSSILVGPLTVLLWVIWTFTRRKNNHLNKCLREKETKALLGGPQDDHEDLNESCDSSLNDCRRFHMTYYDLTKFYQIKQMTRSTVSDVILCALSGALRDYLRNFNGVSNPPNLNISLLVNMRQPANEPQPAATANARRASGTTMRSGQDDDVDKHDNDDSDYGQRQSRKASAQAEKDSDKQQKSQLNCTLVNVPLPTSVEGTVPRLWEIRTIMDELRTSADPWVMLNLQQFLFYLLPTSWYQWLINYIALRNSSMFVSNLRGPQNMVESWCVDLLQRAIFETQQPPQKFQAPPEDDDLDNDDKSTTAQKFKQKSYMRRKQQVRETRLRFRENLGSLAAIYYCMQPPTSNIPISFNCITYHNKLFVSSLSRSLLVEDSKLLIELFFAQLNQLANTIAKRKSFVTIIRTPVPIEISCQPASPVSSSEGNQRRLSFIDKETLDGQGEDEEQQQVRVEVGTGLQRENFSDDELSKIEKRSASFVRSLPPAVGAFKDDIEANLGSVARCSTCKQSACTCRRRKSLFTLNSNNLLSLLHPANYIGTMRTSKSSSGSEEHQQQDSQVECLCGQQLLEELDEDNDRDINDNDDETTVDEGTIVNKDISRTCSRSPSDDGRRMTKKSNVKLKCSKCRYIQQRSTLSLNMTPADNSISDSRGKQSQVTSWLSKLYQQQHQGENKCSSTNISMSSSNNNSRHNLSSHLMNVTRGNSLTETGSFLHSNVRNHSKSETDLLPISNKLNNSGDIGASKSSKERVNRGNNSAATNKDSWTFLIGRRSNKRRQSVATSTGAASNIQRATIVVKDEINADINLRYQLDSPFLVRRSRRLSNVGNVVVGSQRRSSLIPFGLMNNQSISKFFRDDGEAHL